MNEVPNNQHDFDCIIIGSGAGGFSAAIELHELNLRYLLLERATKLSAGLNQIQNEIPNFLGGYYASGEALRQSAEALAERLQLNYRLKCTVDEVDLETKTLHVGHETLRAKSLVLATGYRRRMLPLALKPTFHRGIYYEKHGFGDEIKGRTVAIMGGGDNALMDAVELSDHCPAIYVIHRSKEFRARADVLAAALSKPNINILTNSAISKLHGDDRLRSIDIVDGISDERMHLNVEALIVRIGYDPNTELFAGQIDMDSAGHVKINADCSTSVPGVFAVGDICTPGYPRVATAAGHGIMAAASVNNFVRCSKINLANFE